MLRGRCECGAVQYEAGGEPSEFSHCHCSQCRRLQGAPFVSFVAVDADRIDWKKGREDLAIYASSAKNDRYFCPRCGAHIMVRSRDEPGVAYLTMGCVEGDPELPPASHQFVASKAPWIDIGDGLPQYPESSDD